MRVPAPESVRHANGAHARLASATGVVGGGERHQLVAFEPDDDVGDRTRGHELTFAHGDGVQRDGGEALTVAHVVEQRGRRAGGGEQPGDDDAFDQRHRRHPPTELLRDERTLDHPAAVTAGAASGSAMVSTPVATSVDHRSASKPSGSAAPHPFGRGLLLEQRCEGAPQVVLLG